MKIKMIMITVLLGFLSLSAQAGFEQFGNPFASCWVTPNTTNAPFFMFYDVAPLQAVTTDDRTFELIPNTALYAGGMVTGDPIWCNNGGLGPDGNSDVEANLLWEIPVIPADLTSATMTFDVSAFDMDTIRYTLTAFVKVLNPLTGYSITVSDLQVLTGPLGSTTLTVDLTGQAARMLQIGFVTKGLNASWADDWGSATVTVTDINFTSSDVTAPAPDPMTFVSATPLSDRVISATATTATDANNGVEYNFFNQSTTIESGWQSSPTWIDVGPPSGIQTQMMPIVNPNFTYDPYDDDSWILEGNWDIPWWDGYSTTNGFLNMTQKSDRFAVAFQEIMLSNTDFVPGDTLTVSADVKTLDGLNNGGFFLKMESWNGASQLNFDLGPEPTIPTSGWTTVSRDYTIAAGANSIKVVLTLVPTNGLYSSYGVDNIVVSGLVDLPAGLQPETTYTYFVQARDTSANTNTTGWSNPGISAITPAEDTLPPLPATMMIVDSDVSPATIKLVAATAVDATSGVQYSFECTAGPGHSSGWVDSEIYYDTGLAPGSSCSYTVIARDTSSAKNSNTVSSAINLTTMSSAGPVAVNHALTGFTGDSTDMDNMMSLEKVGLTTGSINTNALIEFDAAGATFGDGLGPEGRDLLKTIATGYGDVSFTAYATFTFPGVIDFAGFIGMGQGLQTGVPDNWGVPELNLFGVNGMVAQFKDVTAGDVANPWCQMFRIIEGNPAEFGGSNITGSAIGSTETIRAKLVHDADAKTVTVSYDRAYTGGAFVEDVVLGTLSTDIASMWIGRPVSVYVGGGEGTIVKDFEVVLVGPAAVEIGTPVISGGFMFFTWDGVAGKTYDVLCNDNPGNGSWETNETIVAVADGPITATPAVIDACAFYKVIER